jgi:hypothetical protein
MDVAWQEGVGSFLDSSGSDLSGTFASFWSGDGTLWSGASDNGVLAGPSLLWSDANADSGDTSSTRLGTGLTDGASGADTPTLSLGSWISDGASGFAASTLHGGLLWAGAGSDTSSSLTSGSGAGLGSLGALDLTAGSSSTLWQQFVDGFGSQFATWAADLPHLLWTGAASQPLVTAPVADGSQALNLATAGSLPLPAAATLAPAQLVWTQPSGATGLATGPSLTDAAPTPPISGAGIVGSSSSNLPIAGAGSQS